MSGDAPRSEVPRRFTPRRRTGVAVAVVVALAAVAIVGVAWALAPSDAEILALATPDTSAWRESGMVTHVSLVIRTDDSASGQVETLRREQWTSYDGQLQRQSTTRLGTDQTFASIYEPDPLRQSNIAEETSSTTVANRDYTAQMVTTPQGASDVVATQATARHEVWWGPCGSCHAPKLGVTSLAQLGLGLPPYLAPLNRSALKVAGNGKVRGRATWVLEATRPSVPEGYSEVTRIDVDTNTYLPLRYRIEVVQDLRDAGHDVVNTTEIDVVSHELVPQSSLPVGWWTLSLSDSEAYAARESFESGVAAVWPPPGAAPSRADTRPPVYDLGEGFVAAGGRIAGVRHTLSLLGPQGSRLGAAGRPDAVVEELHPDAGGARVLRVVAEYGEVTPAGSQPKYGTGEESLADGSSFSPALWVITVPAVNGSTIRGWARGGKVTPFSAGGQSGFEIRGASIEDSLRPFDYGAVVVQMPDATVVVTQPPHAVDAPSLVRDAAAHLVKRQ